MRLDEEATALAAAQHAVYRSACEDFDIGAVDVTITDPPYSARTQDNIRRGKKTRDTIDAPVALGFDPLDVARVATWSQWIARRTRRFALVFSDHESSMLWAESLERAGGEYLRAMIWHRLGGAPEYHGRWPAVGHEVIVLVRFDESAKWNGGGKAGVYSHHVVRGGRFHPNEKPVQLIRDLCRDFVRRSDVVADPFAGSGAIQVAVKQFGARSIGCDLDKKYVDYANRRIAAAAANVDE